MTEHVASDYAPWCEFFASPQIPKPAEDFVLWYDREGLALIAPGFRTPFRLRDEDLRSRQSGRSDLLRACGGLGPEDWVLDPFAGYGVDALMLASTGCQVATMEWHPLIWLLQREFAQRVGIAVDAGLGDGLALLQRQAGNGVPEPAIETGTAEDSRASAEIPSSLSRRYDLIYLDPMFERRRKQALPNRGLQHLQALSVTSSLDVSACVELACAAARRRVVLKRRLKDPVCGKPSHQILGHAVRFDVYS